MDVTGPFTSRSHAALQRASGVRRPFRLDPNIDRSTIPDAEPCYNYYELKPHRAGPMGNVIIRDVEELRPWLPIVRPVTRKVAETQGGCIAFYGTLEGKDKSKSMKPRYFQIPANRAKVYGSATYLPRRRSVCAVDADVTDRSSDTDSTRDGCTDDGAGESRTASRLPSRQNSSLVCRIRARLP